jgi:hypothetical protein
MICRKPIGEAREEAERMTRPMLAIVVFCLGCDMSAQDVAEDARNEQVPAATAADAPDPVLQALEARVAALARQWRQHRQARNDLSLLPIQPGRIYVPPREWPPNLLLPGRSWLDCEGFLTRNESAGFCEAEPPSDWMPFLFQGRLYYRIPLGG